MHKQCKGIQVLVGILVVGHDDYLVEIRELEVQVVEQVQDQKYHQ
jgi:hypothetical protein